MSQTTTSQVFVSVRPPRPTTFTTASSSGECSSTSLSFYTGCINTPSCLSGSTTATDFGDITFNIYGTPELVCIGPTSSSEACSSTSLSFYTGCINTPSCLPGSTTATDFGDVTFNIYGTPELVCVNATMTESTASITSTASESITSSPSMSYTGIASASLQHTPLPTSLSSSPTSSAKPSTNDAGLTTAVSSEFLRMVLLAWVGYFSIRLFRSAL